MVTTRNPVANWGAITLLALAASCSGPEVHLMDRHALAAPLVEAWAQQHPGTSLVLFDAHHDLGRPEDPVSSFNWVGRLVSEGRLDRVYWVSAEVLDGSRRASRRAWISQSLEDTTPSVAERILPRVEVLDSRDLASLRLTGPWVLSVDLDLFASGPEAVGANPDGLLDALAAWAVGARPPLTTVALSAAYEPEAGPLWCRLVRWLEKTLVHDRRLVLDAGPWSVGPESREEAGAWARWARKGPFWPGAGVWAAAPWAVQHSLAVWGVKGDDAVSSRLVEAWSDPDRVALESRFPESARRGLVEAARSSIAQAWSGQSGAEPLADSRVDLGVAVRLMNRGIDRGCLTWYRGAVDEQAVVRWCAGQALGDPRYSPVRPDEAPHLTVEVSLFGPWRPLADPLEFSPGEDSLLLIDGGRTTLLQASLAVERGYDREVFLEHLSAKAGLGPQGWHRPGLVFRRAATLWSLEPLESRSR